MTRKRHAKKQAQEETEISDLLGMMVNDRGLEPITEDLITELASEGADVENLRRLQAAGFKYSRARGSFFSPPELGGL